MKVEVLITFRDILDRSMHHPGDVIEVSSETGENIVAQGTGKEIKEVVAPEAIVNDKPDKEAEPSAKDSPEEKTEGEPASDNKVIPEGEIAPEEKPEDKSSSEDKPKAKPGRPAKTKTVSE